MAALYSRWVPPKPSHAKSGLLKNSDLPEDSQNVPHKPRTEQTSPLVNSHRDEKAIQTDNDSDRSPKRPLLHSDRESEEKSKSSKKRKRREENPAKPELQTGATEGGAENGGSTKASRDKSKESRTRKKRKHVTEEDNLSRVNADSLKVDDLQYPQANIDPEDVKKRKGKENKRSRKHNYQSTESTDSALLSQDHEAPRRIQDQEVEETEDAASSTRHDKVLSKFQRSIEKQALGGALNEAPTSKIIEDETETELHGLEPLPQPETIIEPEYKPDFSALPSWISNPITVPQSAKRAFADLSLEQKTVQTLNQRGLTEALAIQSAVIPMLLGSSGVRKPDLCVAAATGSGKTLAYTLPMVDALKSRPTTKLRGLIIVPTRELVSQVSKVAEQCTAGTHLKIGTAVGNVSLLNEQQTLIEKERQYDPQEYSSLQEKARRRLLCGDIDVKEDVQLLEDAIRMLPGHVPVYTSRIDILVCTPGRLVDHIQSTVGFSLDDIEWLVIDEADRLLADNFQQWVDIVMTALERPPPSAEAQLLAELWLPSERRKVQRIVLSATMTRDVSKLGSLKLWRPKMIVLEGIEITDASNDLGQNPGAQSNELPTTLREFAIPVGDGLEKPLYLLKLLQDNIFAADKSNSEIEDSTDQSDEDASTASSSWNDNLSGLGERLPDSQAAASEAYANFTDNLPIPASDSRLKATNAPSLMPKPQHLSKSKNGTAETPSTRSAKVLIFTNSNENATRLSYLMGVLHPPYAGLIGVLTKASTSLEGKKVIGAFRRGKTSMLIASDRASRGLDLPQLSHVINYDMPKSVISYIHRVGRTARAGMTGDAWTFLTFAEARWFWNAIARASEVLRQHPIERRRLDTAAISADQKQEYEEALRKLQHAVHGHDI